MKYLPTNPASRSKLAHDLVDKLTECGFKLIDAAGDELVFSRTHHAAPSIDVRVYTSCVRVYGELTTRGAGKDAIRVCAVYHTEEGGERGIAKAEKRVNRVGDVSDIVSRMHERMREVYGAIPGGERCRCCGAPTFESKAGNIVCAELCWKK